MQFGVSWVPRVLKQIGPEDDISSPAWAIKAIRCQAESSFWGRASVEAFQPENRGCIKLMRKLDEER